MPMIRETIITTVSASGVVHVAPLGIIQDGAGWIIAPFQGFNRAQAAVIEAAILVSRLHMLPRHKVEAEMAYLAIAIAKTAGPAEQEAWNWLTEKVQATYASQP